MVCFQGLGCRVSLSRPNKMVNNFSYCFYHNDVLLFNNLVSKDTRTKSETNNIACHNSQSKHTIFRICTRLEKNKKLFSETGQLIVTQNVFPFQTICHEINILSNRIICSKHIHGNVSLCAIGKQRKALKGMTYAAQPSLVYLGAREQYIFIHIFIIQEGCRPCM